MPGHFFCAAMLASVLTVGTVGAQPAPLTGKPGLRVDRYGDALPPGALFRIGTSRLQLDRQIQNIVASPDGKFVAAVSDDSLGVWEVPSGREILRRPAYGHGFLAFSPDGKLLAFNTVHSVVLFDLVKGQEHATLGDWAYVGGFAPDAKTLAVWAGLIIAKWDVASGKLLHERQIESEFASYFSESAISPDGKTLATFEPKAKAPKQGVCLHNVATGEVIRRWEIASLMLRALVFSPDGLLLAGISTDGLVRVWEVATGKERARWKVNGAVGIGAFGFAFAPDGESVLCTQPSGLARWHWQTGKLIQEYLDVGGPIAFVSGGKAIAVQGSLGSIRLLDFESGKDFSPMPRVGKHVTFSADERLVAWSEGSAIVLAETVTGKEIRRWQAHVRYVGPLAFAPDGKTLASAGTDRRIRLWDVAGGMQLYALIKTGVDTLFFSSDGQRLVSAAVGEICMWDAVSGERQGVWAASGGAAMAPDLRAVAVPDSKAGVLRLFDPVTGKRLHELPGYRAQVASGLLKSLHRARHLDFQAEFYPAFSLDGRLLMVGGDVGTTAAICVWDVVNGKKMSLVINPSDFVPQNLTMSPDGHLLAALRSDRKMCLISTTAGHIVRALGEAEEDMWPAPAFTPDGRTLVTATKGAVQFWEVATGGEIARQPAHRDDVRELIVSANGRCLATTSWDHAILIWDLTRLATDDRPRHAVIAATEIPALWADLASPDAKKGRRAVETLIAAPGQAVPLLRERLKPATLPDAKKLSAWIADLGSDDFDRRQEAEQDLHRLGEIAVPALQKSLAANPPLEARRRIEGLLKKLNSAELSAEALRGVRAVQVLETIGSHEARAMLQALADGAAASRQTQDAKASLQRLGNASRAP